MTIFYPPTVVRTIAAWSNRVAAEDVVRIFLEPGASVYRAAIVQARLTKEPVLCDYPNPVNDRWYAVLVFEDGSVEFGLYEEDDFA